MQPSMKNRKTLISLLYLLFLIGCTSTDNPGQTPISSHAVATQTQAPLTVSALAHTNEALVITPVPEKNEVFTTPTAMWPQSATLDFGKLVFARYEYYGWFDLVAQDTPQGLVFDETNEFHKHTSLELLKGPGQSTYHVFSHYSDQVAYWTATNPGELWISDVAYRNPYRILLDEEEKYVSEANSLVPWGDIEIVWSPDDLHLFLFHLHNPELSRVYHLETNEFEQWLWRCNSLIISAKSNRVATLCSTIEGVQTTGESYAVLEWGGEIWFSDTLPGELLLEPLPDGTVFWQWSADGKQIAYFDPNDVEGHLFITDARGNIQKLLPGISPFRDSEVEGYQQYELLDTETPLIWARDTRLLLVNGFGQPALPCPPLISEEFEPAKSFTWPCWQALDVEVGNIIWNEASLAESLSLQREGESMSVSMGIGGLTVAPSGEAIATYTTYTHPRIVVVDLQTSKSTILLEFDRINRIYWAD